MYPRKLPSLRQTNNSNQISNGAKNSDHSRSDLIIQRVVSNENLGYQHIRCEANARTQSGTESKDSQDKKSGSTPSTNWTSEEGDTVGQLGQIYPSRRQRISVISDRSTMDILPPINLDTSKDTSLETEYEYPLCDCICFQVFWSPYFAKICENVFGRKLKHSSKKGTVAYGNREPKKPNKVVEAARRLGRSANKKSIKVKRRISKEWRERRPSTWTYQDPRVVEMQAEIKRLRGMIGDTGHPGEAASQLAMGNRNDGSINFNFDRRFTIT